MATTKQLAVMLRKLANKLEADFGSAAETVATLTILGMNGPNAVFPVETIKSRRDDSSGLVVIDFECPKPAGDYIRALLMRECGELIKMAAENDVQSLVKEFEINKNVETKNGVTIH